MNELNTILSHNLPTIFLALAGLVTILIIIMIVQYIKFKNLHRRYRSMLNGSTGTDLEKLLDEHHHLMNTIIHDHEQLTTDVATLQQIQKLAIQKVSIHRFSAFSDVGGDMSYAIALLNQDNNGFILSSIFSRQEHCTYVKPVHNGTSSYALTDEETKVLREALAQ